MGIDLFLTILVKLFESRVSQVFVFILGFIASYAWMCSQMIISIARWLKMYCISQKKICDYVDVNHKSIECNYQEALGKSFKSCQYGCDKFAEIIDKTFNDKDFEEFAKQIEIYENNKYLRNRVREILDSCYVKREEISAMEDIKKIFFDKYFHYKRKKEKETN